MVSVTTERPINPTQLGIELDGAALSVTDYGDHRLIECLGEAVTEAMLRAAVDAHEAGPDAEPGPPEPSPPTDAEVIANLKARLLATEQTLDQIIIDALMGDFPPA